MSEDQKTASLMIIGNEILSGRTQDANTGWLAEQLVGMGIVMKEARIVRDVEEEIVAGVHALQEISDYVFTTGGIGPTHDDITAASVAKAFGTELELNQEAYDTMVKHYGDEKDITEARRKMAMIPKGATLIDNPVSAAPGFVIGNVYVMAGVPRIMQGMFDHAKTMLSAGDPILSSTIACTLAESVVAIKLAKLQDKYPDVDIGSYPNYRAGVLGLNIVLRTTDADLLQKVTDEAIAMVRGFDIEPGAVSMTAAEG